MVGVELVGADVGIEEVGVEESSVVGVMVTGGAVVVLGLVVGEFVVVVGDGFVVVFVVPGRVAVPGDLHPHIKDTAAMNPPPIVIPNRWRTCLLENFLTLMNPLFSIPLPSTILDSSIIAV